MLVNAMRSRLPERGFTLIELLVTMAIAVILLGIAVPSFVSFINSQRLRGASYDLVSDLLASRSEAIRRNGTVTITPVALDSSAWKNGWTATAGAAATTVATRTGLPDAILFAVTDADGAALNTLTLGGDGRISGASTPVQIQIKNNALTQSSWSCVRLDATGRASAKKGQC
jgi:type IV fimbrial biogenesis protein FimT